MSFDVQKLKQASLGGIPFFVDTVTITSGRDVKVHSFGSGTKSGPKPEERVRAKKRGESVTSDSENPFIEDLGKEAFTIELNAYFIQGPRMPDYIATRNAFIEKVNTRGASILQLPTFDKISVISGKITTSYNNKEGGIEKVSVVFYRSVENVQPSSEEDTEQIVIEVSASLGTSIKKSFENRFSVERTMFPGVPVSYGIPSYVKQDTKNMFESFVDKMKEYMSYATSIQKEVNAYVQVLNKYKNDLVTMINYPGQLCEQTVAIVRQMSSIFISPLDAFNAQSSLFKSFPSQFDEIIGDTLDKLQLENNQDSLKNTVRNASLSEMCVLATKIDFKSSAEAISARNEITSFGEEQQSINGNDLELYLMYEDMRTLLSASSKDITERIALLPYIKTIHLSRPTPLLVVAYGLYGDAKRYVEIQDRNRIKSNLVSPLSLEVLSE